MGRGLPCLQGVQGQYSAPSTQILFISSVYIFQFVEDEGDIVFYKNYLGLTASRPILHEGSASDSGIEVEK